MPFSVTTEEYLRKDVDYLEFKAKLLAQCGLAHTAGVEAYLMEACKDAETELKRKIRIDNACSKLLDDYYDGDLTYAFKPKIN